MRIAVNTRFLLKDKLEGIGWFKYETLKRITRNHPEHEFVFFFDRTFDDSFIFSDNITPVVVSPPARHPLLWYLWFEWAIPYYLKKYQAECFISQDGYLSLNTSVRTHLTIHDLAFEHYPEHVDKLTGKYYKRYTPRFAKKAERIVTVSQFSKTDISERYSIRGEKIDVVYNGFNQRFFPLEEKQQATVRDELTGGVPYFLFAGAIQPRKNIDKLFKAFDAFRKQSGIPFKLVIAGRKAWNYSNIIDAYEGMSFKEDVIFTGHLPVETLSKYMSASAALYYVSLFEGFGIPVLEGFGAGVPVVTSNVSSMPEVAADAAYLVDPKNVAEIAESMQKLAVDESLRKQLIVKGLQRVQSFSWDKTADEFWKSVENSVLK